MGLTEGSTCLVFSCDPACGFTWELLSIDHLRSFELSLKAASPKDASTGEVNWVQQLILGVGTVTVTFTTAPKVGSYLICPML